VVYDCDLMRLPLASLIDLTTAVTSSLKSTISKHNSIRERRTEVIGGCLEHIGGGLQPCWILHAGRAREEKDSLNLTEYS
jgi:hypothetical protein